MHWAPGAGGSGGSSSAPRGPGLGGGINSALMELSLPHDFSIAPLFLAA